MPAGVVITWCERGLAVFSIAGLLGCAWLGVVGAGRPVAVTPGGWFLIGSAAGLCLLSGSLLVAGRHIDRLLRRAFRRSARSVSLADRWMIVIASACLLAGAVAEASMFSALIDSMDPSVQGKQS